MLKDELSHRTLRKLEAMRESLAAREASETLAERRDAASAVVARVVVEKRSASVPVRRERVSVVTRRVDRDAETRVERGVFLDRRFGWL